MTSDSGSVFTPGTRVRVTSEMLQGRTGTVLSPAERMYGFDLLVRLDKARGTNRKFFFASSDLEPLS